MTQHVTSLAWMPLGGKDFVANVACAFATDPVWIVDISESFTLGENTIHANFVQVFNQGNNSSATVLIGGSLQFVAAPFSSPIYILPSQPKSIQVTMTSGTVNLQFTEKQFSNDVTNYAGVSGTVASVLPPGMIVPYAGASSPDVTQWLLCFGQAISRTAYAALFANIGITYGVGDGSTTFNVPDLRGRFIAGADAMGGAAANRLTGQPQGVGGAVASVGGEEVHKLIIAEMPSHSHSFTANNLAGSAVISQLSQVPASFSFNTNSTGGDGNHNNIPPTIVLNYIIKL